MASQINKKINIEFVSTGIQEVNKQIETLSAKAGTKDQTRLANIKKELDALMLAMKNSSENMTAELASGFMSNFSKIFREYDSVSRNIILPTNREINAQIDALSLNLEKLRAERDALEKKTIDTAKQHTISPTGAVVAKTKAQATRDFIAASNLEAGTRAFMPGNQNIPSGELLTRRNQSTGNIDAFISATNDIKASLIAIGIEEKDLTETRLRSLVLTQDQQTAFEEQLRSRKITIPVYQSINQLLKRETIENNLKKIHAQKFAQIKKEELELKTKEAQIDAEQLKVNELNLQIAQQAAALDPTQESAKVLQQNIEINQKYTKATKDFKKEQKEATIGTKENTKETEKNSSALSKAAKNVFSYGIAFTALRRVYRETIKTVRDLDHAMTEMAVVTTMTRKEAWNLVPTMQRIAKETGFTTTEISQLSTVYFRQGRSLRDVIELTEVAAKAARVAGISAQESANYLTSAVNGFGLAAKEAERVSDKFAALAASSASSYEELAVGLSKFASQAKIAGLDMDFAMGLLAKGVETTREAPESIGTALKTVLARMRELTDLGKTFEDGMDVNRVEVALKQVGVQLRDSNGQFRDMQNVITEVGKKWSDLNKNQQASVAVALAGTRQQSRLIAMFQDFDRTLELVNISQESAGATAAQHLEYMQGMDAAMTRLTTAWQAFITTITDSEVVIGIVNTISNTIEGISKGFESLGISGQTVMFTLIGIAGAIKGIDLASKLMNITWGNSETINKLLIMVLKKRNITEVAGLALNQATTKQLWKEVYGYNALTKSVAENTVAEKINNNLSKESIIASSKTISLNNQEAQSTKIKTIQINKNTEALIKNKIARNSTQEGLSGTSAFKLNKAKISVPGTDAVPAPAAAKGLVGLVGGAGPLLAIAGVLAVIVGLIALAVKGKKDFEEGKTNTTAARFYLQIKDLFEAISTIINTIVDVLKIFFDVLISIVGIFIGLLKPIFTFFINNARLYLNALKLVWFWLGNIVKGFKNWFNNIKSEVAKNPLIQWFINLGNKYSEFVDKIAKEVLILTSTYEDLNKEVDENFKKVSAETYENKQRINTLKSLKQELDDYNSTLFKTNSSLEKYNELTEKIKDFEDGKYFIWDAQGGLNVEAAIAAMEIGIKEIEKEIRNKQFQFIKDNYRDLITVDLIKFRTDKTKTSFLYSFLASELDFVKDTNFTQEQKDILSNYYEEVLKINPQLYTDIMTDEGLSSFIEANSQSAIEIANFAKQITDSSGDTQSALSLYKSALSKFTDPASQNAFKSYFKNYEIILSNFSDSTDEFIENLSKSGLLKEDLLSSVFNAADLAGEDAEALIKRYIEIYNTINDGTNSILIQNQAWLLLAETINNSFLKNFIFDISVKKTMLEISQSLDLATSSFKRLNDARKSFLEGGLSGQDLYDLVESYADLFSDSTFINKFLNNNNLFNFTLERNLDSYNEATAALNTVINRLRDETDPTERENLLKQYYFYSLLLVDNLQLMSKRQAEYNDLLRQYNLYTKMGIENEELRAQLFDRNLSYFTEEFVRAQEEISEILMTIPEGMIEMVNGIPILNMEEYNKIVDETEQIRIKSAWESLEAITSMTTERMSEIYKESVDNEKRILDEKKKLYENYFKKLDELENQREREKSREDIIKQIQRLEGATDEKSRQKAKELKAELIKMDADFAKDERKKARESVMESLDSQLEEFKNAWKEIFKNMLIDLATGGKSFADSVLEHLGVVLDTDAQDSDNSGIAPPPPPPIVPTGPTGRPFGDQIMSDATTSSITDETTSSITDEELAQKRQNLLNRAFEALLEHISYRYSVNNPTKRIVSYGYDLKSLINPEELLNAYQSGNIQSMFKGQYIQPENIISAYTKKGTSYQKTLERLKEKFLPYKNGGLVDYTGLAMVHGSSSSPETVLSAEQTKMFFGLRDALSSLVQSNLDGTNSSVNIENITIQTQSLNNNLDFKKAGEIMAQAFSKAAGRRGIVLNTKR